MGREASCAWCVGRFCCGNNVICTFGNSVTFTGRMHCLVDAVEYTELTSDDMDIEVEGRLVYGTDSDGGSIGYDTGAENL